jgi:hypothetical protein
MKDLTSNMISKVYSNTLIKDVGEEFCIRQLLHHFIDSLSIKTLKSLFNIKVFTKESVLESSKLDRYENFCNLLYKLRTKDVSIIEASVNTQQQVHNISDTIQIDNKVYQIVEELGTPILRFVGYIAPSIELSDYIKVGTE